jgi:hypothetical protein
VVLFFSFSFRFLLVNCSITADLNVGIYWINLSIS